MLGDIKPDLIDAVLSKLSNLLSMRDKISIGYRVKFSGNKYIDRKSTLLVASIAVTAFCPVTAACI